MDIPKPAAFALIVLHASVSQTYERALPLLGHMTLRRSAPRSESVALQPPEPDY